MNNEEFVNSYLENELNKTEQLDFENKLHHDSELREEYNFQNDLVEGIKSIRRVELKSRLNNIPIHTPIFQTIGFKAIAIASVSVGIGVGAYFSFDSNIQPEGSLINLEKLHITQAEENTIPAIPKAITPILDDDDDDNKTKKTLEQEKLKSEPVAKNTDAKVEAKIIKPNVIQPDVVESFNDASFETKEIYTESQINTLEKIKENIESAVEVATVKDKRNKFHYKFFENKLYLLGNFNDQPYEIIELNMAKGKSYFLFYNDSFYKLSAEQIKPAPLQKIENDSLVSELKIIRLNKNN